LQGYTAKARVAYQYFLTLWKDADPDIPILIAAKPSMRGCIEQLPSQEAVARFRNGFSSGTVGLYASTGSDSVSSFSAASQSSTSPP
jgi:hypothetical protein